MTHVMAGDHRNPDPTDDRWYYGVSHAYPCGRYLDSIGEPKEQPPPETLRQTDYRGRRLWRATGIPVHRRGKPDFGLVHLSGLGQRGVQWADSPLQPRPHPPYSLETTRS